MNYIINPSAIYWIGVVTGLKTFLGVLAGLCAVIALVMLGMYHGAMDSASCPDESLGYADDAKRYKRWLCISLPVAIIFALTACFIPSRNAIIGMQVAKLATYDNAAWTLDMLKEAVDYVVEAISRLK